MKAKDKVALNTVRLIRAAFANAAIEEKTDVLSDEQVSFVALYFYASHQFKDLKSEIQDVE